MTTCWASHKLSSSSSSTLYEVTWSGGFHPSTTIRMCFSTILARISFMAHACALLLILLILCSLIRALLFEWIAHPRHSGTRPVPQLSEEKREHRGPFNTIEGGTYYWCHPYCLSSQAGLTRIMCTTILFYFALLHNKLHTLIVPPPKGNKPHHILALICFFPFVEHNVAS